MTTFEELKKEFIETLRPHSPCSGEYRRVLESTNEEELLKVIHDNIDWCALRKVISKEYFAKFKDQVFIKSNIDTGIDNTGWSNSGYRNSGAFCTDDNPVVYLFDSKTNMKVREWEQSKAFNLMAKGLNFTSWVQANMMAEQEKKDHPKYETTEGYLKTISYKEGWSIFWGNLSKDDKKVFTDLENFDAAKFESITGIKV